MGEACRHLGISYSTLRRWTQNGKIKFHTLSSGQRTVDISSYQEKDNPQEKTRKSILFYSRVSSSKQKDDLQRQKQYLEENYSTQNQEIIHLQDIASGLNFKRKGLISLLERVQQGTIQCVVVASKDRLARFGFDLIEWICNQNNTPIVVLDKDTSTPSEDIGKDILSIIQIYCCKWNGKRRYTQKNKKESQVETLSNS
jgi:excisionase family DNA binding protein